MVIVAKAGVAFFSRLRSKRLILAEKIGSDGLLKGNLSIITKLKAHPGTH